MPGIAQAPDAAGAAVADLAALTAGAAVDENPA